MEFPAWVPAAVRAHISILIEGNAEEPQGWAASLDDAKEQLAKIDRAIKARTSRGVTDNLDDLRKRWADAIGHRDLLANNVGCLRRLANDERMRDAFAMLARESSDDQQLRGFVQAAWAAQMDYGLFRERLKQAAELRDKIAVTADKLAQLLRDISGIGLSNWPSEFFSIPELLRQTDNHEMQDYNLVMWRVMRRHVLGDSPRHNVQKTEPAQSRGDSDPLTEIQHHFLAPGKKPEIDAAEQGRADLRYGWGVSPSLSELLDTVAAAARNFEPSESGVIGSAIDSRKRNRKTEYLRAFGHLLVDGHRIALTPTIMGAMVIAANVVLDLPDNDVSYDDVRKALKNLVARA